MSKKNNHYLDKDKVLESLSNKNLSVEDKEKIFNYIDCTRDLSSNLLSKIVSSNNELEINEFIEKCDLFGKDLENLDPSILKFKNAVEKRSTLDKDISLRYFKSIKEGPKDDMFLERDFPKMIYIRSALVAKEEQLYSNYLSDKGRSEETSSLEYFIYALVIVFIFILIHKKSKNK